MKSWVVVDVVLFLPQETTWFFLALKGNKIIPCVCSGGRINWAACPLSKQRKHEVWGSGLVTFGKSVCRTALQRLGQSELESNDLFRPWELSTPGVRLFWMWCRRNRTGTVSCFPVIEMPAIITVCCLSGSYFGKEVYLPRLLVGCRHPGGLGVGHGSCDCSRVELSLSRCRAGRQLISNKVCVPVAFEKNSLHHFYTRSFFLSMSTSCLLAKRYVLAETGSVAQVRNEGIDP